MIRFSAFLVAAALGLLIAGVVTSKLLLVYIAIGVSGVALLTLGAGAAVKWSELFGKSETAEPVVSGLGRAEPVPAYVPDTQPEAVRSAWPAAPQPSPPLAGYLPTDQPAPRPAAAAQPWGSAFPEPAVPAAGRSPAASGQRPPDVQRPADVRRPAAFTPRPAAGPQSPPPGPPIPGAVTPSSPPGVWEWRDDTIAAAPPRPAPRPAPAEPPIAPAQAAPPAEPAPSAQPASALVNGREPVEPSLTADPGDPAETSAEAPVPADTGPVGEARVDHLPDETVVFTAVDRPAAEDRPASPDKPVAEQQPAPEPAPAPEAAAAKPATAKHATAEPATAEPATAEPAAVPPAVPDLQMEVTVVPGVPRYHTARCILIRFMGDDDLGKMTLAAARDSGCTPCRACQPDHPETSPE